MVPNHHPEKKGRTLKIIIFLTIIFAFGCFREFYKVNRADLEEFKETVNIGSIEKYYIIHYQDLARELTNISFQNGQIYGVLNVLPIDRYSYLNTNPKTANRYKPEEKNVLHEVHLFLNDTLPIKLTTGAFTAPLSTIREIQIYDKDNGATVISHVVGFATIGVGVALIADAMLQPTSHPTPKPTPTYTYGESSCPYVYANNGETFRLQGEIFGGAIFPNLERHDYLPLPDIQAVDGNYQLMISNELQEIQHVNLARLVVVEHPEGSEVLLDQRGNAHTLIEPQIARAAVNSNGSNILPLLAEKDFRPYFFEDGDQLFNSLERSFEKPADQSQGKLILSTKNSLWLDFIFGQFTKKQGAYYHHWVAEQHKRPAGELTQWADEQGMRLGVYLQRNGTWELVERIQNIGPLAFRDLVVPIDLSDHHNGEVKIKLEGGHLFWDLDYAAMDFSENLPVEYLEHNPVLAKATDGQIYTQSLAGDDNRYLDQSMTGHQVKVWYDTIPKRPGFEQALFLHSKGYYEHVRDYTGLPDLIELPKFDRPAYFIEFSKDRFQVYLETNNLIP